MSVQPEFPASEYESRWRRARAAMEAAGVDGLLLTSEANYRYFSGHFSRFWVSKARPFLMLLPREREPVLLMTDNQFPLASETSPVRDIRSWEGFMPEAIPALAGAIRDAGLADGRIGAELGFKQRMGMPFNEFVRLREMVPGAAFVDAADLLWELRMIKSPAEVAYLRESIRITCGAYDAAFAAAKPGMTEREVYRAFTVALLQGGAERLGYITVTSGEGNYHRRTGGPTDRKLEEGDLLWFDGGCTYFGYWADLSRMVAVGSRSREQAEAYRNIMAVVRMTLEEVKAGNPIGGIDRRARAELDSLGYPYGSASRVGHGIGLDQTEPPSIIDGVEAPLRAGMVLSTEPTYLAGHGLYQIEELYAVTETGYDLLTHPAPAELRVVS